MDDLMMACIGHQSKLQDIYIYMYVMIFFSYHIYII